MAVFTRDSAWQPFERTIVSTFTGTQSGHGPNAVTIADLAGDRQPDLATTNQVSGDVTLLTNTTRRRC